MINKIALHPIQIGTYLIKDFILEGHHFCVSILSNWQYLIIKLYVR